MRTTTVLSVSKHVANRISFTHRAWRIVPDTAQPNRFTLEETKTAKVLGIFTLTENSNPALLDRIAAAPELQDIAEMYRDSMVGNKAEKTMVFEMVNEIINRITPHSV